MYLSGIQLSLPPCLIYSVCLLHTARLSLHILTLQESLVLSSVHMRSCYQLRSLFPSMFCFVLCNILEENSQKQADDLGAQFTDIFIKEPENVTLILALLEVAAHEFLHVQWR